MNMRTTNVTDLALYEKVSQRCSKLITASYSTSFNLGIYALAAPMRASIRNLYAFVRMADEIVDTFHDFDKKYLLERFRQDTLEAIQQRISYHPVLHAFQKTVHDHAIDHQLIMAFLESMEMDLHYRNYHEAAFDQYIYGSAEVVGLMCLKVFCEGNETLYEQLKVAAKSLGAAFQKVNFLRDMQADKLQRGRIYFPGAHANFDTQIKQDIEKDIRRDFDRALDGIRRLPVSSRFGVYVAYIYFARLFRKISKTTPEKILETRVRVNNAEKLMLLATSYVRVKMGRI